MFTLILIAILLYFVFTRSDAFRMPDRKEKDNVMDILKERFAKGEIDETTYLEMKKRLEE